MSDVVSRHRTACDGFSSRVDAVKDQWDAATPCPDWTVRDLVEHVVGNHEGVVAALGGTVARDPDDLAATWRAVSSAAFQAFEGEGALDTVVPGPMGEMPVGRFLNILTTDVLVHTWDLARAIGADETIDAELAQRAYEKALPGDDLLRAPGLFGPKVAPPDGATPQETMLCFFGREVRS